MCFQSVSLHFFLLPFKLSDCINSLETNIWMLNSLPHRHFLDVYITCHQSWWDTNSVVALRKTEVSCCLTCELMIRNSRFYSARSEAAAVKRWLLPLSATCSGPQYLIAKFNQSLSFSPGLKLNSVELLIRFSGALCSSY